MQAGFSRHFKPPMWARNAHLQTILAKYLAPQRRLTEQAERMQLADGDEVQLNWSLPLAQPGQPLVVLLHGLEGNIQSHYVRGMFKALQQQGFAVVLLHFRGCDGVPNKLKRAYHSGDTADFAALLTLCQQRFPTSPLAAVGFSLGGNVLVKYCGETGSANPLCAAVAICAPLQLSDSCDRINQGLSKLFYQRYLLGRLKRTMQRKLQVHADFPLQQHQLKQIRTIRQFDDALTAPLHGFCHANDYYQRCSGLQFLPKVSKPLWLIFASDDPFLSASAIPAQVQPPVSLTVQQHGGHVGFVSGPPWRPAYWLDQVVPAYLSAQLSQTQPAATPQPDTAAHLSQETATC